MARRKQGGRSNASNVNWGICTNTSGKADGTKCSKCVNKEKQAIRASKDFVCQECGEPLMKTTPPPPPTPWALIIAAAVVVIGGGIGAFFGIKSNNEKKDSLQHIQDSIQLVEQESLQRINDSIRVADSIQKAINDSIFQIQQDSILALEEASTMDSVHVVINKGVFEMTAGDNDTLKATFTPEDAEVIVRYASSNESVALVTSTGVIHAIAEGEADITVVVTPAKGVADTALAKVTVKKKKVAAPTYGTKNLGYGTYTGPLKGGKPHGVGGKVTVKKTTTMDLKDGHNRKLQLDPGDVIENTKFENGVLHQGEIRRPDGTRKWFNI